MLNAYEMSEGDIEEEASSKGEDVSRTLQLSQHNAQDETHEGGAS